MLSTCRIQSGMEGLGAYNHYRFRNQYGISVNEDRVLKRMVSQHHDVKSIEQEMTA
jgi:hypothetical protein